MASNWWQMRKPSSRKEPARRKIRDFCDAFSRAQAWDIVGLRIHGAFLPQKWDHGKADRQHRGATDALPAGHYNGAETDCRDCRKYADRISSNVLKGSFMLGLSGSSSGLVKSWPMRCKAATLTVVSQRPHDVFLPGWQPPPKACGTQISGIGAPSGTASSPRERSYVTSCTR